MKILHIDMTGPYTEGLTYQENIIPSIHSQIGNDVELWVTTKAYENGKIVCNKNYNKRLSDGVLLRRFEYVNYGFGLITKKIRNIKNIYKELEVSNPDFIMLHDFATKATLEVCRYVKNHPKVKFVADVHSDYLNSATNIISKYILHRIIYRKYAHVAYDTVEKLYCISPEAKQFVVENYGLKKEKLKLLPLGATIPDEKEYNSKRRQRRNELGVDENITVFMHSGKLTPLKRTRDILQAMEQLKNIDCRLIIIGSADDELTKILKQAEQRDYRIKYLGWKSGNELSEWLCAGDVYVLPGDQSNTVQTAMCRREAVIVYPYENYLSFGRDNICSVKQLDELKEAMSKLSNDMKYRERMRDNAFGYAKKALDYSIQAKKILE